MKTMINHVLVWINDSQVCGKSALVFAQTLRSSSKVLFELDFLHGAFYCCVGT